MFAIVTLTMLMILLGCGYMFYETCKPTLSHKECDHLWMELRDSIYNDLVHVDSIFATPIPSNKVNEKVILSESNKSTSKKFIFTQNDIEILKKTQKTLIARQDKMADDLRQETNNMINKVNGWLSFWMSVMAVLGVFVPIALQFKLYRETRDSDQTLREQHKEDRLRIEEFIRQSQADIKGEYLQLGAKLQHEYNNYRNKIARQIQSARFFVNVRNFQNLADCSSISMNEARNTLLRRNWDEVVTYARTFISDYINHSEHQEDHDAYNLSVLLIEIAEVLTTLRRLYPHRSRRLLFLMEESYRIITEINAVQLDRKGISNSLIAYSESLCSLNPFYS